MTVGSLFAGVGGIDQGFEAAGFDVRWQVELDDDAAGVLASRWPSARRYRDVRHVGAAGTVLTSAARIKALSWPVGARSIDALAIASANVVEPTDWIIGGFPCQDVSVAGKRKGLIGARTGLFWEFMRIADELKPKGLLLENVPGLLSSHRGRDFQTVLGALAERGFRRAYRILDSQYFGVPQRRRRVFIVGCARTSGLDPRTILFESVGGEGDPAKSRAARPSIATSLRGRSSRAGVRPPGRGGEDDQNIIAFDTTQITSAENRSRPDVGRPSHPLSASAHAPSIAFTLPAVHRGVGQGHNTNYLPIVGPVGGGDHGSGRRSMDDANFVYDVAATLNSGGNSGGFRTEPGEHLITATLQGAGHSAQPEPGSGIVVARSGERARALVGSMHRRHDDDTDTLIASPITASAGHHGHSSPRGDGSDNLIAGALSGNKVAGGWRCGPDEVAANQAIASRAGVRRLTPLECERLQGYPDGWTCRCGKGHLGSQHCTCPDTPRYKQCGNGVSAPVAEWIARRIVEAVA